MENSYLILLDDNASALVELIEARIDSDIQIEVDSSRDKLGCLVDEPEPIILIPRSCYFPSDSVFHELLHVRRFYLDSIPRIILCMDYDGDYEGWNQDPENARKLDKALRRLDNNIEHLIIVPKELAYYSERKSYWEKRVVIALDNSQSPDLSEVDQKCAAIVNWAFVYHVLPDTELTARVDNLVRDLNIEEGFLNTLLRLLNDKEKFVKKLFDHLGLPVEAGCLQSFYLETNLRSEKVLTELD